MAFLIGGFLFAIAEGLIARSLHEPARTTLGIGLAVLVAVAALVVNATSDEAAGDVGLGVILGLPFFIAMLRQRGEERQPSNLDRGGP